ncbi:kinase-like domain-containing protein [Flagelloscypha sp. PMI_526]|nr:kinase-like domain-containing protein [Flagelloscypha sp. PMI_526]
MAEPGLCERCSQLQDLLKQGHRSDSSQIQQILAEKQCRHCGIINPMILGSTCFRVECMTLNTTFVDRQPIRLPPTPPVFQGLSGGGFKSPGSTGALNPDRNGGFGTTNDTYSAIQDRMKKFKNVPNPAVGAALAQGSVNAAASKTHIIWSARLSSKPNSIDSALGRGSFEVHTETYLSDVLSIILEKGLRREFARSYGTNNAELANEDVSIRLPGNRVIAVSDAGTTVGVFMSTLLNVHSLAGLAASYSPQDRRLVNAYGSAKCLVLEVYVDKAKYMTRQEWQDIEDSDDDPYTWGRAQNKRKPSSGPLEEPIGGSRRAIDIPTSSFRLGGSHPRRFSGVQSAATTIAVRKLIPEVSTEDSSSIVLGVAPNSLGNAIIQDQSWVRGSQKLGFKVKYEGKNYIAKRFFRKNSEPLPEGITDDPPSINTGGGLIQQEILRNHHAQDALKAFYEFARRMTEGLASDKRPVIDWDVEFTEAFILEEFKPENGIKFSPAANAEAYTEEHVISFEESLAESSENSLIDTFYWLVEPLRPTTVIKFNGTLDQEVVGLDTTSKTIAAFIHWSWGFSEREFVLCDLQGTRTFKGEQEILTLFDVIFSGTGVGDYGVDGVKKFFETHKCRALCHALGLSEEDGWALTLPLNENDSDEE